MNKSMFIKKSTNVVYIKRSLFPKGKHYMNVEYERAQYRKSFIYVCIKRRLFPKGKHYMNVSHKSAQYRKSLTKKRLLVDREIIKIEILASYYYQLVVLLRTEVRVCKKRSYLETKKKLRHVITCHGFVLCSGEIPFLCVVRFNNSCYSVSDILRRAA